MKQRNKSERVFGVATSEAAYRLLGGVLCTGLVGLAGCGKSLTIGSKSNGGGGLSVTSTASSGNAAVSSGPQTYAFTTNYTYRPVDILIIRDGESQQNPIGNLLDEALPVLSARLWNLASTVGSVHVAVLDQYYDKNNTGNNPPSGGYIDPTLPINDSTNKSNILQAESVSAADFNTSLTARIDEAGTRGGDSQPEEVLLDALADAGMSGGGNFPGFFRPNAFWSVLYISAALNPDDPNDPGDVVKAIGSHGAGFEISALAIDAGGCTYANTTPPQKANPNGDPQRNLELKLATLTSGVVGSVCANTYALFMDNFAQQATGSEYFAVSLPNPVQASSIQITALDGVPVKDFRYTPGTTELDVSTVVPSGQTISVQATPTAPLPAPFVSTDPGDPTVPTALPPVMPSTGS